MPDLKLPSGNVKVSIDQGVVRARGIRYATSTPKGEPTIYAQGCGEPIQVSETPISPQTESMVLKKLFGGFPEGTRQNPQCQYLSVTAPEKSAGGRPVIVWLHGGGYANSSPNFKIYDAESIVREQDVVVVKPAYRLGYLGFGGVETGHPANLGAMDVLVSLEWVQQNIEAFGGDPGNVTIAGESSGGDLALSLLAADGIKGMVHNVIAQSPPLGIYPMSIKDVKGTLTRNGLWGSEDYSYIQSKIEKAAWAKGSGFMPFGIRWGQYPYPAGNPISQMVNHSSGIRVLIGVNSDETGHYLMGIPVLRSLYNNKHSFPFIKRLLVNPTTWFIFSRGSKKLYRKLRRQGETYYYRFSLIGQPAVHMSELPFVFGDVQNPAWQDSPLFKTGTDKNELLIHQAGMRMRYLWGDFVKGSSPAGFRDECIEVEMHR